jgi:hypothetical protein
MRVVGHCPPEPTVCALPADRQIPWFSIFRFDEATYNSWRFMHWDVQVLVWGFKRQFTHESGHALMCHLRQISCYGIAYDKSDPRFCTLRELPEQGAPLTESQRLILAAGAAAEQLSLDTSDWQDGAESDKKYFTDEHSFDEAVKTAGEILLCHKSTIEALCLVLMNKAKEFQGCIEQLPECKFNSHDYAILLDAQELAGVIGAN